MTTLHTVHPGSTLADSRTIHWPPLWRTLFRFVYSYIFLYAVYGLSDVYAFLSAPFVKGRFVFPIDDALSRFVPWFAAHILRIHQPITYSPSGDASFSWVEHLLFLLAALLAALVWSALDTKRPHYRVPDQWLRLLVRFTLASLMFAYGFDKVYPIQFHSITRPDLVQPFGSLDHFSLMWHFMAASKGYTIFSGLLEVAAGVCLIIPMLTNIGSLLAVAVMSNVVALNLAYNIPVKLFSSNILLMAIFLSAPQIPRLIRTLILNRDVPPQAPERLSRSVKVDSTVRRVQFALGVLVFFAFLFEQRAHYAQIRQREAAIAPMQGIWQLDKFSTTGEPEHSLFTPLLAREMHFQSGDDRWLRLIFDQPGTLVIQTLNGELDYTEMKLDSSGNVADVSDAGDKDWKAKLIFDHLDPKHMHVQGSVNGVAVEASMHRVDESLFAVKDEGLHWVNK